MSTKSTKPVALRIPERVLDQISGRAARENISVSDWLRDAIYKKLEAHEEQDRLAALEARLMTRLDGIDKSINSLVLVEEA